MPYPQVLERGSHNHWLMQPQYEEEVETITLDRDLTLLKIKANPADQILFQTFFCVECRDFVAIGGLFPTAFRQHQGHHLAWLPSVDEPAPGQAADLIAKWLAKVDLTPARRHWLAEISTKAALNWAWVCNEDEYEDWANYLDTYLDSVLENWLAALNGIDSPLFTAETIWRTGRPTHFHFKWSEMA